jgi:hypothetical protein
MNNIFKDQAYRLLLSSIKNEITQELSSLQSDVIFIKDVKNIVRNFQNNLAERVKPYFNHICDRNGETIRKIKTPYNSFTRTHLPRIDEFDKFFDESFSKERLENNHIQRIQDLKNRVQIYLKGNLIKDEGMPKQWKTNSPTLDIPTHSIDRFRFNAICSQTIFRHLIDVGDVSDYVISCMYEELSRINTWQYASNKFLRTDSVYVSLSALMEYGKKPHTEYHDFTDPETKLRYPLSSNYEYADLVSFQLKTNYKLPRLIGIACKKEALNDVREIDHLLGISL